MSAFTVPTDAPEADGTLSWDSTTVIVVSVHAGDSTGLGWSYGAAAVADLITRQARRSGHRSDALDVAGTFDAMVRAIRNIGRSGVGGQAISALDTALWDLKARLLGLPLYRLLGAVRDACRGVRQRRIHHLRRPPTAGPIDPLGRANWRSRG